MKNGIKSGLSVILLASSMSCLADATTSVVPYVSFRSQSENAALEIAGVTNHIHKVFIEKKVVETPKPRTFGSHFKKLYSSIFRRDSVVANGKVDRKVASKVVVSGERKGEHYGCFSVTPEYTRSFDDDAIAKNLFGCFYLQNCSSLSITGSSVVDRGEKDLLANWFYLPNDYEGTISFAPSIQNVNVDLNLYWGMDKWARGLYFRMHAPITWSEWNLNARFNTSESGTLVNGDTTYLSSAEDFFCKEGVLTGVGLGTTLVHPLTSARFCGCACDGNRSITRLADIQADLGWDFLRRQNGYLGLFVRGVAPTGNRPTGKWLFEPIIGNGHHWELGGGLSASGIFWRNSDEDKHCGLYIEANITHLFNALQQRVFDLKGMPLSRYMTARKLNLPEMAPVANLTATSINSSIAVQADIVAMFNVTLGNFTLDAGYNFWTTTREILRCSHLSDNCYGKGLIKNAPFVSTAVADNWALDSASDIHEALAPAVYKTLTNADIDYDGARTRGMSHKVFGHLGYSWTRCKVVPFIGVGGQAEFGRNDECKTACASTCQSVDTCPSNHGAWVSLTQWGVWLKSGVSF